MAWVKCSVHDQMEQLIPVGWMAKRLRVPVSWLREEAADGRVPHLKAGKQILFNPEAVEAALLKRAIEASQHLAPDDLLEGSA